MDANPDQVVIPSNSKERSSKANTSPWSVSNSAAAVSAQNTGKKKKGTYKAVAFAMKPAGTHGFNYDTSRVVNDIANEVANAINDINDDAARASGEERNYSGRNQAPGKHDGPGVSGAGGESSSSSSDENGPTMSASQRHRMSTMAGRLSPDHPTQKALRHAFIGWPEFMGPGEYEKRLVRLADTFVDRHHLLERYMKELDEEKKKTSRLNAALNAEVRLHKATLEELTQEATAYESLRHTKAQLDLELMDWKGRLQMMQTKNAEMQRRLQELESSQNKRKKK
jgi:hypothetical protein